MRWEARRCRPKQKAVTPQGATVSVLHVVVDGGTLQHPTFGRFVSKTLPCLAVHSSWMCRPTTNTKGRACLQNQVKEISLHRGR